MIAADNQSEGEQAGAHRKTMPGNATHANGKPRQSRARAYRVESRQATTLAHSSSKHAAIASMTVVA